MPTTVDRVLPTMTDQGCASGLEGTANAGTALAPIGAISQMLTSTASAIQRHSSAVIKRPMAAPATARMRSRASTVLRPGSQARACVNKAESCGTASGLHGGDGGRSRPCMPHRGQTQATRPMPSISVEVSASASVEVHDQRRHARPRCRWRWSRWRPAATRPCRAARDGGRAPAGYATGTSISAQPKANTASGHNAQAACAVKSELATTLTSEVSSMMRKPSRICRFGAHVAGLASAVPGARA